MWQKYMHGILAAVTHWFWIIMWPIVCLLQTSKPTLLSGYSQTSATFDCHFAFFLLQHIFAYQSAQAKLYFTKLCQSRDATFQSYFKAISQNMRIFKMIISGYLQSDCRDVLPQGTYCGSPQTQTNDVWFTVYLEGVSWGLGQPSMHTSKVLLNLILSFTEQTSISILIDSKETDSQ